MDSANLALAVALGLPPRDPSAAAKTVIAFIILRLPFLLRRCMVRNSTSSLPIQNSTLLVLVADFAKLHTPGFSAVSIRTTHLRAHTYGIGTAMNFLGNWLGVFTAPYFIKPGQSRMECQIRVRLQHLNPLLSRQRRD